MNDQSLAWSHHQGLTLTDGWGGKWRNSSFLVKPSKFHVTINIFGFGQTIKKCTGRKAQVYIYICVCIYTRICACWGSPAEEWLSLLASPSQEGHTNSWSIPCEMSDIKQNQRGCFFWFGVLQVLQGEQNTRTWWFQLTPCRTKPKTNMVLLNQTAE